MQDRAFELHRPPGRRLGLGRHEGQRPPASSADADEGEAGGAFLFADPLAALVAGEAGRQGRSTLHAVGHSAGAIFHAHLLPLLVEQGAVGSTSLSVLAPAVRNDLFKPTHLLPLATSAAIERLLMFTMTEEAEREDDLIEPAGIPIYGKSLLYLISRAFEPKRKTPILGLDETLRRMTPRCWLSSTAVARRLELSPRGRQAAQPATARAKRHGCFDNDDADDAHCRRADSRRRDPTGRAVPRRRLRRADPAAGDGRFDPVAMAAAAGRAGMPALAGGLAPRAERRQARGYASASIATPSSPLAGCVRDARTWGTALRSTRLRRSLRCSTSRPRGPRILERADAAW